MIAGINHMAFLGEFDQSFVDQCPGGGANVVHHRRILFIFGRQQFTRANRFAFAAYGEQIKNRLAERSV